MSCTQGCPLPGSHTSWGECLRSKAPRFSGLDQTAEKKNTSEVNAYRQAVAEGHDPAGTSMAKVRQATEFGEKTGMPYSNDTVQVHLEKKAGLR